MTRTALLLLVVLLASGCSKKQPDPKSPRTYMGRTIATPMSWAGADWLDRPGRDASEQPEHVLDVLEIHEGQVVADVGAGTGYFTMRIALRVGPSGRVYATEIQPEMLEAVIDKVRDVKLANVIPILATPTDAKLPRGAIDLVLMVDVYHELPWPKETLDQIHDALRPGGRVALVEYRAEDPTVLIKPEHEMTLAQIKAELGASRFVFVSSDESLPQQRIVVFTAAP